MESRTYPEYSINYPLLLTTFMKRPVDLYPDEIGVVYRNPNSGEYFRFTWLEWYQRTCRLANALGGKLGVRPGKPGQPGERVATMALNHHRHLELYYAVPCSGAVLHPINMRLSPDHIVHTVQHAEDKVIFVDDLVLPLLERIYDQIKDRVETFVYISDKPGLPNTKVQPLLDYEDLIADQPAEIEWPHLHEDTHATLCYTTATTGLPKGVMFTHRALYLMTLHLEHLAALSTDPSIPHLGENTVPMVMTPFFHIHAWGAPFRDVTCANKMVLPGHFTVEGFCELIQTEKVTATGVVPTVLAMLLESDALQRYDLSSLKYLGVGGGALPLGLKRKAEKALPNFRVVSGYGMTETAPVTIVAFVKKNLWHLSEEELDAVRVKTGLPVPGLEVRVVDEKMNSVPRDNETIGEIVMRGPWVMMEYYKDPEKTAEVWRGGWFHTGDMAKVDQTGYIIIADRMKDMIRSGAEMVPTVLLENLTATADFVLEATYVGVPDPVWGQRPMAIVTLVPGANETAEELVEWLDEFGVQEGKIAKWMLPDYVVITNEIPKTSVGKFDKIAIRNDIDKYVRQATVTKREKG